MSIMPYPPGHDPRTAFLSRPRPDWPDEEPDPDAVVDELRRRWRQGSFPFENSTRFPGLLKHPGK